MGSSKPKASERAVLAALAPFGFPKGPGAGLGFTAEDDALMAQGYPHLRSLTDEPIAAGAAVKQAEKALDAIDPFFRLAIPREIARRFLLGYRVGPLLFVGEGFPKQNAKLRDERAKAIRSDKPIDEALLRATLDAHGWRMGDTYSSWRMPKVLYLYEAFLGTEPVARAVVDHLLANANPKNFKRWEDVGDGERLNSAPCYIALALPWLLRRLPPKKAASLRAELAAVRDPEKLSEDQPQNYVRLLRVLADPKAPVPRDLGGVSAEIALTRDDATTLSARFDRNPHLLLQQAGRVCFVLGTARFAGPLSIAGYDHPRIVDGLAPVNDAGVVRVMAYIATQRAGRAAAREWLTQHAKMARPILEALRKVGDPKEEKAATAGLELLGSEKAQKAEKATAAKPKAKSKAAKTDAPLDEKALEKEIKAIFATLKKALVAAKGKKSAEVTAIRDAHEAYTEARSAAGDPIPEAYFTHRFGDFGVEKWAMLAVDSID